MIFKNDLHSSQGKSERIDWIKEEIKKFTLTDELAKINVNVIGMPTLSLHGESGIVGLVLTI